MKTEHFIHDKPGAGWRLTVQEKMLDGARLGPGGEGLVVGTVVYGQETAIKGMGVQEQHDQCCILAKPGMDPIEP